MYSSKEQKPTSNDIYQEIVYSKDPDNVELDRNPIDPAINEETNTAISLPYNSPHTLINQIGKFKEYLQQKNKLSEKISKALICFENFIRKENKIPLLNEEPLYDAKALANLLYMFVEEEKEVDIAFLQIMAYSALASSPGGYTSLDLFLKTLADKLKSSSYPTLYQSLLEYCFEQLLIRHAENMKNNNSRNLMLEKWNVLLKALKRLPNQEERERLKEEYSKNIYHYLPGIALKHFLEFVEIVKKVTKEKLGQKTIIEVAEKNENNLENYIKENEENALGAPEPDNQYITRSQNAFWNNFQTYILKDARNLEYIGDLINPVMEGLYANGKFVNNFLNAINNDQIIKCRMDYQKTLKDQLKAIAEKLPTLINNIGHKQSLNEVRRTLEKIIEKFNFSNADSTNAALELDEFERFNNMLTERETRGLSFIRDFLKVNGNNDDMPYYNEPDMTAFLKRFLQYDNSNRVLWRYIGRILISNHTSQGKPLTKILSELSVHVNPHKNKDLGDVENKLLNNLFVLLHSCFYYLEENYKYHSCHNLKYDILINVCKGLPGLTFNYPLFNKKNNASVERKPQESILNREVNEYSPQVEMKNLQMDEIDLEASFDKEHLSRTPSQENSEKQVFSETYSAQILFHSAFRVRNERRNKHANLNKNTASATQNLLSSEAFSKHEPKMNKGMGLESKALTHSADIRHQKFVSKDSTFPYFGLFDENSTLGKRNLGDQSSEDQIRLGNKSPEDPKNPEHPEDPSNENSNVQNRNIYKKSKQ